jgi:hypothetical protein
LNNLSGKYYKARVASLSYATLFVLAGASLVLLGPLRDFTLATIPSTAVLAAAFLLFMLPGAVLAGLLGNSYSVPARIPFVFALSTGVFGLLALPALVMKWRLDLYLLVCGGVLIVSLAGAALLAVWKWDHRADPRVPERGEWWLWIPLGGLSATLVATSLNTHHPPNTDDTWSYLMYVRKFLEAGPLNDFTSGFARTTLSGWLLEQAAIVRVSGIDPVDLVLTYLTPALIVVAILAFYGLSRALFQDASAALLSSSLYALFFLVYLSSSFNSPGGEFVRRITEDKFVARFIFLPVALSLALFFLRERKLRYLGLFAFICGSVVAVHPLGLVLIGISMTGFGLVYLTVNWRNWRAWASFGALGAAMLSIVLPPVAYLLATGSPLLSRLASTETTRADFLLATWEDQERLLELGDGSYIMHPALLLEPVMLAAYVLGIPFLIWRLERSLAAQLLLGVLLFVPVLIYIPPVTTFIGEIIGP